MSIPISRFIPEPLTLLVFAFASALYICVSISSLKIGFSSLPFFFQILNICVNRQYAVHFDTGKRK